tara:strand:+ start:37 stop:378 length:342 start_codon:yes stop_codon:yes gene_type:complete
MAISRYKKSKITTVGGGAYKEILKNRPKKNIVALIFEQFKELKVSEIAGLALETHVWGPSDRFFKLSNKYYGTPLYWWVIAYFNQTPLEADVKVGQKMLIPVPLERILEVMDY